MREIFGSSNNGHFQRIWLAFLFIGSAECAFSQESTGKKDTLNFRSAVSVTNNGISFIPAFSLGKPAAMLDMSIGWKRFSFEPQFRFALEGKPWAFIFIYRYKMIIQKRFQLTTGIQLPGMIFINKPITTGGITSDGLVVNRYVVGELIPSYSITHKTNLGIYYSYARGVEKEAIQVSHYVSLSVGFNNVILSRQMRLTFAPQVFYLRLDQLDGYYFSASMVISRIKFPVSIGSMMYKAIRTDVAGKDSMWNLSLIYSFNKKFTMEK